MCSCVTADACQLDSAMEQKGKRDNSPEAQQLPLVSSNLFLYFPFLFGRRDGGEEWWEIMWEDIGCVGATMPSL
jgi:hypothetical protein